MDNPVVIAAVKSHAITELQPAAATDSDTGHGGCAPSILRGEQGDPPDAGAAHVEAEESGRSRNRDACSRAQHVLV